MNFQNDGHLNILKVYFYLLKLLLFINVLQRRTGLQAARGETAAPDEKTLSPRQPAMSSSALLQ